MSTQWLENVAKSQGGAIKAMCWDMSFQRCAL